MKKILTAIGYKGMIHALAFACVFILPSVALAADAAPATNDSFVPLTNIPGLISEGNAPTLPAFFNGLYKICIGAAAVLAIIEIMYAGFQFMTNKGSVSSNEAAKSRIQNAILGLILVLSPVIVFGIINPSILKLDINVSGLQTSTSTWFAGASSTPAASTTAEKNAANVNMPRLTGSCQIAYSDTRSVTLGAGNDPAIVCAAYDAGAGYEPADASCCTDLAEGNVCCGLKAKNGIHF